MKTAPATIAMAFTPANWRDAIEGSATELARVALNFTGAKADPVEVLPPGLVSAHIPMIGSRCYELSLEITREAAAQLAGAMLYSEPGSLEPSEIRDAIGEIVNMLAGGVKRRLPGGVDLELGLPVFVNGAVEPSSRCSLMSFALQLGSVGAYVVVIGPK
jgi:CheY-specific phosphatase CheX